MIKRSIFKTLVIATGLVLSLGVTTLAESDNQSTTLAGNDTVIVVSITKQIIDTVASTYVLNDNGSVENVNTEVLNAEINSVGIEDFQNNTNTTDGSTNTVGQNLAEATGYQDLGNFILTSYCGCRKCNGKWVGKPGAYGLPLEINRTVAVDSRVIPLGTWVEIFIPNKGWQRFRAEDTGSGVKGNHIDVYIGETHSDCYNSSYNTDGSYSAPVRVVK